MLPNPFALGFSNLTFVVSKWSLYLEKGLDVVASCADVVSSCLLALWEKENYSCPFLLVLVSPWVCSVVGFEVTPDMAKIWGADGWPFSNKALRVT